MSKASMSKRLPSQIGSKSVRSIVVLDAIEDIFTVDNSHNPD